MTKSRNINAPRFQWTDARTALLTRLYPDVQSKDIAAQLGCSVQVVYTKASRLGLLKSAEFLAGPGCGRIKKGESRSTSTRFKPGHKTWNAGLKGLQIGGKETQFKKGSRNGRAAELWRPIGHERINGDGYRQRKLTDTGNTPRDYVMVHRIVWEEHNGPIPPKHVVTFRNRDRSDVRIENLECISRQELTRRNTIARHPPELRQLMNLNARLRRTIQKKAEQQQATQEATP
jgi:hypothetical protein